MVRRAARLALALALGALSGCAPRAAVRPGGAGHPTHLRYDGAAEAVALTGDMTGWSPVALAPDGAGFALDLVLPPGRYEYRLEVRRAGRVEPVLPAGAERTGDGFGGENAVLRVLP